jgi:lactoylglutathione lyase
MIKGLYETHLFVADLQRSIDFYTRVLQLKQCYYEAERKAAFFWIGSDKQAMLGLWEKPKEQIDFRHFAFECDLDFVLHESVQFLKSHGITPWNFLKNGEEVPMVFTWLPALSIYFSDPDGHSLEFISLLKGDSQPEQGVVSYPKWVALQTKNQ